MRNGVFRIVWILAILLAVVLGLLNVWLGDLNQDEGWYIYAAKLVCQGELPYRDFAFTQAPVMPYVYAAALPIVERWGLLGGRIFTMLLGLLTAGAAAWAAYRFARQEKREAALAAFILICVNCYHSYFTSVAKTYSLCALFLSAGFLFLSWKGSRRGLLACTLSGVLFALASGTRISAVVAIPVVLVWLVVKRDRESPLDWLGFASGALVTGLLVFLPLCMAAPENFWFFNVGYHSARESGSLMNILIYKVGFLSRWMRGYTIAFFLAAVLGLYWLNRPRGRQVRLQGRGFRQDSETPVLWFAGLAITIIHFMAPFPYEDYQVAVFPIFAIALAIGFVKLMSHALRSSRLLHLSLAGLLAISAISAFSSPINQEWMVIGRDLIWWRIKEKPDMVKLREAGEWLRGEAERRNTILTQDAYLAVESGLELPRGMEMGPFCYYPHLSTERASRLNVLNRDMMEELLKTVDAAVAASSEYGFAIAAPAIERVGEDEKRRLEELLEERYECMHKIPDFGQGHTLLQLYRKRQ